MSLQIVYKKRARSDVRNAFAWYEKQRVGLGFEFLNCLEDAVYRIRYSPLLYPEMHGNLRRVLFKRFPYSLFYLIEADTIYIFSVFDNRQDPGKLP
ncbi:MAG: type II toxin-antitoxin system RelE/ParE family toxin [Desulfobulbaceae bacterium]|nr:type II toxin-antitoxin system RelE/ParE family toxin [Desulfobulbaceae bacterium]